MGCPANSVIARMNPFRDRCRARDWPCNRIAGVSSADLQEVTGALERIGNGGLDLFSAQVLGDDFAIRTDQSDRGNSAHAVFFREAGLIPFTEETLNPAQSLFGGVLPGIVSRLIQAQADHHEALIFAERFEDRFQMRRLGQARTTPGRPEVEQDVLAPVVSQDCWWSPVLSSVDSLDCGTPGAGSPTFTTARFLAGLSGITPRSSGSSLRPPGIGGTVTTRRAVPSAIVAGQEPPRVARMAR